MSVAAFIAARAKRPEPAPEKAETESDAAEIKGLDSVIKAIEGLGEILKDQAKADAEDDKAEREAMAKVMQEVGQELTQIVPAIAAAVGAAIQAREAQQDAQLKMICDALCAMKDDTAAAQDKTNALLERIADSMKDMA